MSGMRVEVAELLPLLVVLVVALVLLRLCEDSDATVWSLMAVALDADVAYVLTIE